MMIGATQEMGRTARRYTSYPPSILVVTDDLRQALKLGQVLENNDCCVYQTNTSLAGLTATRQKYFDLIVLDLEPASIDGLEIGQKLKTNPDLTGLPIILLATGDPGEEGLNIDPGLVYHISKAARAEIRVLQLVEHLHYLIYRYM
jgi:CheY-like chemotaxis protein